MRVLPTAHYALPAKTFRYVLKHPDRSSELSATHRSDRRDSTVRPADSPQFHCESLQMYTHRILNDYPLGSGILRELIQNSDDAEANSQVRAVLFCAQSANLSMTSHMLQILVLDSRSFGTSTLLDPVLARYQGPALLAFNDSKFTEKDWKSLMSISNSEKKDDISKAGKVRESHLARLLL
jgi:hypothetical protein